MRTEKKTLPITNTTIIYFVSDYLRLSQSDRGLPRPHHSDGDHPRLSSSPGLRRRCLGTLGRDGSQDGGHQAGGHQELAGVSLWLTSGLPPSLPSFALQTDLVDFPVGDKDVEEGETEKDESYDDSTPN